MTAEKAVQTLEKMVAHYEKALPGQIEQVKAAIQAIRDYIRIAEGKMASNELDVLANEIEMEDPVVAMAIDKISDILEEKR